MVPAAIVIALVEHIPIVPVETFLGWVLSGPMNVVHDDSQISVNLVGHVMPKDR